MKTNAHILTVMVDNEFGVITRITAQIRRDGWSIRSLAVSEGTDDSMLSRITLALECYDTALPTVVHRISHLDCVRSVTAFDPDTHVSREMTLARVTWDDQAAVNKVADSFGAKAIHREGNSLVFELVDTPERVTEFADALQAFKPVDMARTGAIVMEKSKDM